jgi:hypothetical protein
VPKKGGTDFAANIITLAAMAVFGERQLVAENLHTAEMRFERHDQSVAIDLREQHLLHVGKRDQVRHEIIAIGQGDVNLQVQLAAYLIGKD